MHGDAETEEANSPAKSDAEIAKELAHCPEARQWLSAQNHALFEIAKEDGQKLVENFYAAGAPKVYIYDASKMGDGEVAATFIVELPTDKTQRKKVFDAEAAWWKQMGEEGTKDVGQKYLDVATD